MSRTQHKKHSSIKPESLSNINDFIVQSNINLVKKKPGEEKAEVQMKIDLNAPDKLPQIGGKSELAITEQDS